MSDEPRLRGDSGRPSGPWPIGQIPDSVIYAIGKEIVYRLAIGYKDISGNEFGNIFADSISGKHYKSPLGLADVALNETAWSVKTVKDNQPHKKRIVRLISGRNSPNYSHGIENAHIDLRKTGQSVLSIWNNRLNEAKSNHYDTRLIVLIRNMEKKEFALFEEEINRHIPGDYKWSKNSRGNLEGRNKADGSHHFTWQSHGSQFTIIRHVPGSVIRFRINHDVPLIVEPNRVLKSIEYNDNWIAIN